MGLDPWYNTSMTYFKTKRPSGFIKPKVFTNLNEYLAQCPKIELESRDYKFLSLAEQQSRLSTRGHHKVGCVIVQKGEVLGSGYNTVKTHPFQAKWNRNSSCLHAEMSALLEALRIPDLTPERVTVYVSRYTRKGLLGCSYPCKSCWAALSHIGLKRVVCYDQHDKPTKLIAH